MKTLNKASVGGLALAAVIGGGMFMASALPASAADSTSGSMSSTTAQDPSQGGHRSNGVAESPLTGDTAARVTAAVQAAYPDATIQRVENDADGATYEAHILQADGTTATVKLDADFAVTGTETGGGRGGHGRGAHQNNGVTETELTGDTADKVKAAVLAANPDATINRMENDADGATYEAHIIQADGSRATVKLDASFNITATETGGPGSGGKSSDSSTDGSTSSSTSGTSS